MNPNNTDLIYQYYILKSENYSNYSELVVDENDNVLGILFGSTEKTSLFNTLMYVIKEIKIFLWLIYHILLGDFGKRKNAIKAIYEIKNENILVKFISNRLDTELNLFVVSPELRGKGFGKQLMNRYIDYCRQNNLSKIYLWTDEDCNYQFYEKYGFKLYRKYYNKNNKANNNNLKGMIYCLSIN